MDNQMIVEFSKNKKILGIEGNVIFLPISKVKTKDDWRDLGFKLSQFAMKHSITKIELENLPMKSKEFIEGTFLGNYTFDMKSKSKDTYISYTYNGKSSLNFDKFYAMVEDTIHRTDAQNRVRDLVNTPPNIANINYIVDETLALFRNTNIEIEVKTNLELEELGMFGHLAVNAASNQPATTIKLTYTPENFNKNTKHHIFVGKGLTYDSGGLSIKPTPSMVNMQVDKAGAMTLIGLMSYLISNESSSKVTSYIALAENMINENAYRPGDIITMMNRKTVKVNNTDAEGRIVLADNICLAQYENKKFDTITSIATLTGSALVQFGAEAAGLVSFNDKLKKKVQNSGKNTDELFMDAQFHKYMLDGVDDEVADLSNTGTKYMGCQKAGLFLTNFIKKRNKNKFLHIDIAGPAFADKAFGTNPKGATGFGVRSLIDFIK